jgi:hypothetical protein
MKDTLNELEQSLIQGGCTSPYDNIIIPGGGSTIWDPTQEDLPPDCLFDFKKHLIIH